MSQSWKNFFRLNEDEKIRIPFIKKNKHSPAKDCKLIIRDSGDPGYLNRLLIGTATTGTVRIEWVGARYGQIIPTNWSMVQMNQYMGGYAPLRYQVADAQNLIVKHAIMNDFEWLLLLESDVVMPPHALVKFNTYIQGQNFPIMSGLCYTRSRNPCEPMIYRGRGTGPFYEWEMGDMVYCDGVPTGILLVHMGILRLMWDDAKEYQIPYGNHDITKEVFRTPRDTWIDPETAQWNTTTGTSDLDWCTRVIEGDYIRKAGWNHYMDNLENEEFPLVVDTNIFCRHINPNGEMFP